MRLMCMIVVAPRALQRGMVQREGKDNADGRRPAGWAQMICRMHGVRIRGTRPPDAAPTIQCSSLIILLSNKKIKIQAKKVKLGPFGSFYLNS